MTDVPDWSSVQSPANGEIASGTWTAAPGNSSASTTLDPVPPLTQGVVILARTPLDGTATLSSVVWVGDTTQFQFYAEVGQTAGFALAYLQVPGATDISGTLTAYFDNTGATAVDVPFQVISQAEFEQRGTNLLPISVTNTNVTQLYVSQVKTGSATGNVSLTTAAQTLVPAPTSKYVRVVDTVTLFNATAGDLIVLAMNGAGNQLAWQYTQGPPIPLGCVLTSGNGGLTVLNFSAARGNAYAAYHDERA